jgi:hypothetical protein
MISPVLTAESLCAKFAEALFLRRASVVLTVAIAQRSARVTRETKALSAFSVAAPLLASPASRPINN